MARSDASSACVPVISISSAALGKPPPLVICERVRLIYRHHMRPDSDCKSSRQSRPFGRIWLHEGTRFPANGGGSTARLVAFATRDNADTGADRAHRPLTGDQMRLDMPLPPVRSHFGTPPLLSQITAHLVAFARPFGRR